jgi:hypothetical protein
LFTDVELQKFYGLGGGVVSRWVKSRPEVYKALVYFYDRGDRVITDLETLKKIRSTYRANLSEHFSICVDTVTDWKKKRPLVYKAMMLYYVEVVLKA